MNLWQTIRQCFRHWNSNSLKGKNKDFKDKTPVPWNLYDMKTAGEAKHEFYRVHLYFKLWMVYPITLIAKWIFRKSWDNPIPNEHYNKNFFIFDRAYEKTIDQWYKIYRYNKITTKSLPSDKLQKAIDNPNQILRVLKKLFYKLAMTDTIYREFFNMMIFNLTHEMSKEYKGKDVRQLLFTDHDVSDITYFVMDKVIADDNRDLSGPFTVNLVPTGSTKKENGNKEN